jgi:hypothetical protein
MTARDAGSTFPIVMRCSPAMRPTDPASRFRAEFRHRETRFLALKARRAAILAHHRLASLALAVPQPVALLVTGLSRFPNGRQAHLSQLMRLSVMTCPRAEPQPGGVFGNLLLGSVNSPELPLPCHLLDEDNRPEASIARHA